MGERAFLGRLLCGACGVEREAPCSLHGAQPDGGSPIVHAGRSVAKEVTPVAPKRGEELDPRARIGPSIDANLDALRAWLSR